MTTAEILLAFSGFALQAISLVVMFFNKTYKLFSWFFIYLSTNCLFTVALFVVRDHSRLYSVLYWTADAIVNLFIFLAIYEIFHSVFLHFYAFRWFRMVFPASSVILISIGSLRSVFRAGPAEGFLISQIFAFEIATYILQVGIFLLFLVLVRFFRLPWKQYTFGIALGFGVSAAGSLVAFLVRSEFGTKFVPIFRFVVPMTYTIGVAIWLLTFLWPVTKSQLEATAPALTPEAVVTELKQYTRTVKEILKR
jgi:hypothetical protein